MPNGIRLAVKITPNAKKSEVIGILDDTLKIRLRAQPVEGQANEALIRYIADTLNVPKSAVIITHGHTSPRKILDIGAPELTVTNVKQALLPGKLQ